MEFRAEAWAADLTDGRPAEMRLWGDFNCSPAGRERRRRRIWQNPGKSRYSVTIFIGEHADVSLTYTGTSK